MTPGVLGLIPARGGSKGVPRKNLRPLGGQPLIVHTVEAALAATTLERVIVSTDDEEIAEAARQAGAGVPFLRPTEYASDTASSISVVHHALAWYGAYGGGYQPHAVALLSPTCPFRTADQIDAVVRLLDDAHADSACTVTLSRTHPYFIYSRDEHGRLRPLLDLADRPLRRQDLPAYYTHSQAVLVSRTAYLKTCDGRAPFVNFGSLVGWEIDAVSALDIDSLQDLETAELLYGRRHVRA